MEGWLSTLTYSRLCKYSSVLFSLNKEKKKVGSRKILLPLVDLLRIRIGNDVKRPFLKCEG
jgi:hypothetical protein